MSAVCRVRPKFLKAHKCAEALSPLQDPIVLLVHKLLDAETFVEAREAGARLQTAIHDHIDRL